MTYIYHFNVEESVELLSELSLILFNSLNSSEFKYASNDYNVIESCKNAHHFGARLHDTNWYWLNQKIPSHFHCCLGIKEQGTLGKISEVYHSLI